MTRNVAPEPRRAPVRHHDRSGQGGHSRTSASRPKSVLALSTPGAQTNFWLAFPKQKFAGRSDIDRELSGFPHDASLSKMPSAGPVASLPMQFKNWRALKAYVDSISVDGQIVGAAVRGDAPELAQLLTEHPAKAKLIGGSQWNRRLLHLAAEGGHLECIRLLLARGADVHQRDRLDRASALHWAAQEGRLEAVRLLAEAGGEIDGGGDEHEAGVIGWATCFRAVHRDVAEWLLKRGAKPTIFSSIALGRGDLVR